MESRHQTYLFAHQNAQAAHHPYKLPVDYKTECMEGKLPIHPTICYSDDALRKYFNRVKNADWYENTVFIITADHTAQSVDKKYGSSKGIYAIPLVIFDPSNTVHQLIKNTTQQADITPTALDYLGIPVDMIAFGQSALNANQDGFSVSYLSGLYQLIRNEHTILFDGEKLVSAYYNDDNQLKTRFIQKPTKAINESEEKLKAIIQAYNDRMINNKLTVDD